MNRITIETEQIAGIPLLTIAPEGARQCPLVFFIHGFTGDKVDGVELGYRLADAGMVCVSVDAAMHGDRRDTRLAQVLDPRHPHVYPIDTGLPGLDAAHLVFQIVAQTAEDIGRLITHFASDSRVATERLGVTGASMGGLVTYYLAANYPQITTAVPMISFPNFARGWDDLVLETAATEQAAALATVAETLQEHTAFVQQLDPMDKLLRFAPKPLLMLLGNTDTNAPKFLTVELYRQLLPLYADHPERLQMRIYANIDHRTTGDMISDAYQWFRRYLL